MILGTQALHAEIANVVEDPDAEGLTRDTAAGRVVDDWPILFNGDDTRVGELAVAAIGVEPAHGEKPAQDACIAQSKHNVSIPENFAPPIVPAGHLRRDLDGRQRSLAASSPSFRSPIVPMVALRNHAIRHFPCFGRMKVEGQEHQE